MATERKWGHQLKQRGTKTDPKRHLSSGLIKNVCEVIARGNYKQVAFDRYGIPARTWKYWQAKGKKEFHQVSSGKLDFSDRSICYDLYTHMLEACGERDVAVVDVLMHEDTPAEIKFKLYKASRPKLFAPAGARFDDETGEETKVDPLTQLEDRLKDLLERE